MIFTAKFPALLATASLFATAWVSPAGAQGEGAVFADFNRAMLEEHVVPQHMRFAESAATLKEQTDVLCGRPSAERLVAARSAFGGAVTGWARVQHLSFAPQEIGMRKFRVQFWPDPKNRTARRITQYLHENDRALLEQDRFIKTSVTIQGLPALEQLLFEKESADAILAAGEEGEARCALAARIADNIDEIASGLLADWTSPGGFRDEILEPDEDGYYDSPIEVANNFFTHLHDALELSLDAKLVRPMGIDPLRADGNRAEYHRSGYSLASLRASLEAARDMWGAERGTGAFRALARARGVDEGLMTRIDAAFDELDTAASGIEEPLAATVEDEAARPALDRTREAIQNVRSLLREELGPQLDLIVGFNSRDGD